MNLLKITVNDNTLYNTDSIISISEEIKSGDLYYCIEFPNGLVYKKIEDITNEFKRLIRNK